MRALNLLHDPAPPPWRYRLGRLWRRRALRRAICVQIPALALGLAAVALAADPATHVAVSRNLDALRAALTERPEFAIRRIEIEGASPQVEAEIRASLIDAQGASSIDLDAGAVRRRIEGLGWVESARVSLEAPEALRVAVVERRAVAIWRIDGEPVLIDANGVDIAPAFSRADRPDLPVVAGEGADKAVAEALAILAAAGSLADRVRGLVRVGERRWDVALERDITLCLPSDEPASAMSRAAAMQDSDRLFDREVAVVDLRLPDRPTMRLTPLAHEAALAARRPKPPGKNT
jgi:cell division protein FtsQ